MELKFIFTFVNAVIIGCFFVASLALLINFKKFNTMQRVGSIGIITLLVLIVVYADEISNKFN